MEYLGKKALLAYINPPLSYESPRFEYQDQVPSFNLMQTFRNERKIYLFRRIRRNSQSSIRSMNYSKKRNKSYKKDKNLSDSLIESEEIISKKRNNFDCQKETFHIKLVSLENRFKDNQKSTKRAKKAYK